MITFLLTMALGSPLAAQNPAEQPVDDRPRVEQQETDGPSITLSAAKTVTSAKGRKEFALVISNQMMEPCVMMTTDIINNCCVRDITLTHVPSRQSWPLSCTNMTLAIFRLKPIGPGETYTATLAFGGDWCLAHNSNKTMHDLMLPGVYRISMKVPYKTGLDHLLPNPGFEDFRTWPFKVVTADWTVAIGSAALLPFESPAEPAKWDTVPAGVIAIDHAAGDAAALRERYISAVDQTEPQLVSEDLCLVTCGAELDQGDTVRVARCELSDEVADGARVIHLEIMHTRDRWSGMLGDGKNLASWRPVVKAPMALSAGKYRIRASWQAVQLIDSAKAYPGRDGRREYQYDFEVAEGEKP
jgi:hypothetical protein